MEILFLVQSLVFEKCSKGSHTWSTSVTAEMLAFPSLWQDESLWDCREGRKEGRILEYICTEKSQSFPLDAVALGDSPGQPTRTEGLANLEAGFEAMGVPFRGAEEGSFEKLDHPSEERETVPGQRRKCGWY